MNTFIIAGHIGQNAEQKVIRDKNYVSFSIAENQRITNKETGEVQEVVNWYNVLYRGDKIADYLTKGTQVQVVGELRVDVYRSESSGTVKVSRSVFANTLQLLSSTAGENQKQEAAATPMPQTPEVAATETHQTPEAEDELSF